MQLVRNPREKSRLILGAVAGIVIGAMLPDRWNPWIYASAWIQAHKGGAS